MTLVATDIGGTHSRFVIETDSGPAIYLYRNSGFDNFYQACERFVAEAQIGPEGISRMVLALPAPVDRSPVRLTNIAWEVDRAQLQQQFGIADLRLINDFQAAAVGALHAPGGRQLNPEASAAEAGPAVVTGAGTGLGHAWFADVASPALPWPTEGGHADFAPQDEQQYRLHAWLAKRHAGHVSLERILSGSGLAAVYEFLHQHPLEPAAVTAQARAGDPQAEAAIDLFMRIFGAHAGNIALQFNPVAGIHICGGVVSHLAPWFGDAFLQGYQAKGRMRANVESIPVFLHDDSDIGLQGALYIAKQELN